MNTVLSERAFNNPAHQAIQGRAAPLGSDKKAVPTVYSLLAENDFLRDGAEQNGPSSRYVAINDNLSTSFSSRGGSASKAFSNQGRTMDIVYKFKGDADN